MAADQHDPDARVDDAMDTVAQLIRTAGRRADPPAQAYEQTLAAATAAWETKMRARGRRRMLGAIAASAVLASGVAFLVTNLPQQSAASAGRTDRIIGTVEARSSAGRDWTTLRDELQSLPVGTHLRTRAGSRAGIVLASGVSLRLADATEITLESSSQLRVLTGRVYLDTGAAGTDAGRVQVVTDAGIASDIGTQFEVLFRDHAYRLRVREGRVQLSREAGQVDGDAGEELTIDAAGALERTRIERDDSEWQWVESVAPAPDIDEQPVTVLLAWVARETGRTIQYEKPEVAHKASTTILHGNISHLAPLEALSVMLATTDLEYALPDDGTILVRLKVTQ